MNEETNVMEMPEMEEFFQKHYIRIDERNRVVSFFSDAFDIPPPQDGETDVLINDKGGRHVRLLIDGEFTEENPVNLMFDWQNIPLLKWDAKAKKIVRRTDKDLRADIEAIPPHVPHVPVEARIEELTKAVGYVAKTVGIIAGTLPKERQAEIMQLQQAMFGGVLADGILPGAVRNG